MKVIISAEEIMDRGRWEEFCEDRGLNVWAVNEGLMDEGEEFVLSPEEAHKYGIHIGDKND